VKTQPEPHRFWWARSEVSWREFVAEAAKSWTAALRDCDSGCAPTPAIAYAVRTFGDIGAINFTASHNPPEYNGISFHARWGAGAAGGDQAD